MKKSQRKNDLYLFDIIQSIHRIDEYIKDMDYNDFIKDNKTIDAVVRNLEVIGEASKHISIELKNKYPALPWEEMYYLRNKITHEYFGIDLAIIWDIIKNHLPTNLLQIKEICQKEEIVFSNDLFN